MLANIIPSTPISLQLSPLLWHGPPSESECAIPLPFLKGTFHNPTPRNYRRYQTRNVWKLYLHSNLAIFKVSILNFKGGGKLPANPHVPAVLTVIDHSRSATQVDRCPWTRDQIAGNAQSILSPHLEKRVGEIRKNHHLEKVPGLGKNVSFLQWICTYIYIIYMILF